MAACPLKSVHFVTEGDFLAVRYNVACRRIWHERLAIGLPTGFGLTACILTPDDDDYDEDFGIAANIAHWVLLPVPGGVDPVFGADAVHRFETIPTPVTLRNLAATASARLAQPAINIDVLPRLTRGPLPVVAVGAGAGPGGAGVPAVVGAGLPGLIAALGGGAGGGAGAAAAAPAVAGAGGAAGAAAPGAAAAVPDIRACPLITGLLGDRKIEFREAVARMCQTALPTWPLEGPRTTLWVCRFMVDNGGSPLARHGRWRSEARLTNSDGGVGEHERCCRALEIMACWDQMNLPDLAVAEMLARSVQLQEERWRDRLAGDDYASGLDSHLFYGTSSVRGNVCVSPALQQFVSAELAKEYSVAKERRKAGEERNTARAKQKGKHNKKDDGSP